MDPLTRLTSRCSVRRVATTLVAAALPLVTVVGAVRPVDAENGPVPGPPSNDGMQPIVVPANATCGEGTTEFRVEQFVDGEFHGGIWVTIDVANSRDGRVFDWKSNIGVDAVIVNGGPNANSYVYGPEDTADTDLHAPMNPTTENRKSFDPSHILFCYDNDPPPMTAPPTTAPPATALPTRATPAPAVRAQARYTG
jgi:hypothetical protein